MNLNLSKHQRELLNFVMEFDTELGDNDTPEEYLEKVLINRIHKILERDRRVDTTNVRSLAT